MSLLGFHTRLQQLLIAWLTAHQEHSDFFELEMRELSHTDCPARPYHHPDCLLQVSGWCLWVDSVSFGWQGSP